MTTLTIVLRSNIGPKVYVLWVILAFVMQIWTSSHIVHVYSVLTEIIFAINIVKYSVTELCLRAFRYRVNDGGQGFKPLPMPFP